MTLEETIRAFLAFWKTHSNFDMSYDAASGLLITKGCDGKFGTCCAKSYDLDGLAESLEDLAGTPKGKEP